MALSMLKYLDNVAAIIAAIGKYMGDGDERALAVAISRQIALAIEETVVPGALGFVDKAKVVAAVQALIDAFAPAQTVAGPGDEWDNV